MTSDEATRGRDASSAAAEDELIARWAASAERRPVSPTAGQLERLAAIARMELSGALLQGSGETLARIAEATGPLVAGCSGISVLLFDRRRDAFIRSASTMPDQERDEPAMRVRRRGASRWIVEHGRGLYVEDVALDPFGANAMLAESGNRSYVGLPIRADGEVLGVLYALGREPSAFTDEDVELLAVVADRAAVVIRTAREHERVRRLLGISQALDRAATELHLPGPMAERVTAALTTLADELQLDALAFTPAGSERLIEEVVVGVEPKALSVTAEGGAVDHRRRLEVPVAAGGDRSGTLVGAVIDGVTDDAQLDALSHLAQHLSAACSRAHALEALRSSNGALAEFAHIASHDLRSPLSTVSGFIDLLLMTDGDALSDQGRQFAEQALGATHRMAATITALLEHAELRTRPLELEEVDLTALVAAVVEDLSGQIRSLDAVVEVRDLPTVTVDPRAFRVVLQNLVSNGLKFHREGVPPRVEVSAEEHDGRFDLRVADDGVGVSENDRERVFGMFERGGRGSASGTGIGLATVQTIVDAHGADVRLEQNVPFGTVAVVTLPRTGRASGPTPPRG